MAIDGKQAIGTSLRMVLQGMSTLRVMHWIKQKPGREMAIGLKYVDGKAQWHMLVTEVDGSAVFDQTAETFEQVNSMLVVALGRDF